MRGMRGSALRDSQTVLLVQASLLTRGLTRTLSLLLTPSLTLILTLVLTLVLTPKT
jgi:hypothetical protein